MRLFSFFKTVLARFLWGGQADLPAADDRDAAGRPSITPKPAFVFEPGPEAPVERKESVPLSPVSLLEPGGEDLDLAIGAIFDRPAPKLDAAPTEVAETGHDDSAARELFASIAANFSRPVKNFVHELERGTATREWIDICQPVMGSIIDGAESFGLHEVAKRMTDFREALALAQTGDGQRLDEDSRALILSCYEALVEVMPQTFELGEEDRRRESIIIHSLLGQIPEVGRVTFEKLYGAGVTSLDALFLATADDLTVATGVPKWLCERICSKVKEHRHRLESTSAERAHFDHRGRLVELLKELRKQNETFHRVSREEDPDLAGDKREALRGRQATALQVNLALAEMGHVDLVDELKRLAVERRIERIEEFLSARAVSPAASATGAGAREATPQAR